MKHLCVPYLLIDNEIPVNELSQKLDLVQRRRIEAVPWPAYSYKPKVSFAIAYSDNSICLKYYVSEKSIRAVYAHPNDPVFKDSCVEFFISFEDEKEYYNFEFNCAGTCLLGFGTERANRKLLPENVILLIRNQALLKPAYSQNANIDWELTVLIPLKVFHYHDIKTLKGKRCRANFYKCGDELPEPHFLAWNNIKTDHPNFHVPECFGSMEFSSNILAP